MRAAIYTRISTEDQSDYSLEKQERDCRAEIERRGWTVAGVYTDEGISAKHTKRPALTRLRADVQSKKIQAVVVHKTDRLMRNLRLLLEFIEVVRLHNAAFVSVTENIDFSSPLGWAMFQVQGVFSELYINNLREETIKGLTEKAQQGHWVGGICPYGYTRVDKDTIAPSYDQHTTAVRQIFDLYSTGQHSYATIARLMNDQNIGRHFGNEAIRDILSNRAYCGYVSSGIVYKGNHAAIITDIQWDACAALRASRATKQHDSDHPRPRNNPRGILLDVGCCAVCGQRLWQRIGGNPASRNGYYMCAGKSRQNCNQKMSNIDRTDAAALDIVRGFALAVELRQDMLAAAQVIVEAAPAERPALDTDALQARLDRLSTAWAAGNLSDTIYQQQTAAIRRQLEVAPVVIAPQAFDMAAAVAALESLSTLIEHASIEERRALMNLLFRTVWVQEGGNIHAVQAKPLYGVLWRETRRLFNSKRETGISRRQWNLLSAWRGAPLHSRHQPAA